MLEKKRDILLCGDELSSRVRERQADLSYSQYKNASYSIANQALSYFLLVELMN